MPYFPPPQEAGGGNFSGTPVLIPSTDIYSVPENTQLLLEKRIRIEDGGRLKFEGNSILVEAR